MEQDIQVSVKKTQKLSLFYLTTSAASSSSLAIYKLWSKDSIDDFSPLHLFGKCISVTLFMSAAVVEERKRPRARRRKPAG